MNILIRIALPRQFERVSSHTSDVSRHELKYALKAYANCKDNYKPAHLLNLIRTFPNLMKKHCTFNNS